MKKVDTTLTAQSARSGAREKAELLLDVLSTFKNNFETGISEFELISQLKKPPYQVFNERALDNSVALFTTHFVLFHALYRLREQWRNSQVGELDIHTTNIVLKPLTTAVNHSEQGCCQALDERDALALYYLNWDNLKNTGEADIDALLNSFWERMFAKPPGETKDVISRCHRILNLPPNEDVSFSILKAHYRRRLLKVHPDKGGSQKAAQEVINAYQQLLIYYDF